MLSIEPEPVHLPGLLHIVGGGPPCVMASTAGKRLGIGDPRSKPTTEGIASIVKQLGSQVYFVLVENVEALLTVINGG